MKLIVLFSLICLCHCVKNKDHFHIKLEPDPDRSPRLVENESDPDMVKLKNIQDKIFTVVSNTSLSKEFESFQQLLSVVDSEAGLELGRLFFNGILIGMGKDNSNQILTEFWEDLQYQLSPDLVEAFKDYKDFARGMDFRAMPAIMDVIFQKDNLGNSLAKMPLGQLVDMVQPEASKYGIDIRGFVNGILGKGGDSKFPDMVRKLIQNFNATTLLKAATGSIMKEEELLSDANQQVVKREIKVKESPLTMFKPFIANALKQNGIELDVDAVIQVITPFIDGGGEILQQLLKTFGGKDMNLAQLAPVLGLLGGIGTHGGKGKQPDLMQLAMSLLNTDNNNQQGPDVGSMLKLATTLLGGTKEKDSSIKAKQGNDLGGFDAASMLKMANSLLGSVGNKEKSGNDLGGFDAASMLKMANSLLGSVDNKEKSGNDLGGFDAASMLKMANSLLGSVGSKEKSGGGLDMDSIGSMVKLLSQSSGGSNNMLNMASELMDKLKKSSQPKEPKNQVEARLRGLDKERNSEEPASTDINRDSGYINSKLIKALRTYLLDIENDPKSHKDIYKMSSIANIYLSDKIHQAGGVGRLIGTVLGSIEKLGDGSLHFNGIQKALSLSEGDWADMFSLFEDKSFRDMIKLQSIPPISSLLTELVKRISDGKFGLPNQARAVLLNMGLNDLSIDNFPKKLKDMSELISKATSMPNSLTTLFVPLQEYLYDLRDWVYESSKELEKLSPEELNELVGQSIELDVSISILLLRVAAKASILNVECLPQALCEASKYTEGDTGVAVLVKKLGSLSYGLYAARSQKEVPFFVQVVRASILNEDCETTFPVSCPPMEYTDGPPVDYEAAADHDEL